MPAQGIYITIGACLNALMIAQRIGYVEHDRAQCGSVFYYFCRKRNHSTPVLHARRCFHIRYFRWSEVWSLRNNDGLLRAAIGSVVVGNFECDVILPCQLISVHGVPFHARPAVAEVPFPRGDISAQIARIVIELDCRVCVWGARFETEVCGWRLVQLPFYEVGSPINCLQAGIQILFS